MQPMLPDFKKVLIDVNMHFIIMENHGNGNKQQTSLHCHQVGNIYYCMMTHTGFDERADEHV